MIGQLSILELFASSPTMMVLALCSIVTVTFAIERWIYFASTTVDARTFMRELAPKMRVGNVDAALEQCKGSKASLARVVEHALRHLELRRESLRRRLDTAIELEHVEMERHLGILGTMSHIAPLLGLFGTVVGIIRAFAEIARTGSGGGSVVALGVAEALLTTAAGIVVAVLATICFNVFARQIRRRSVDLEDAREEFLSLLAHRRDTQAEDELAATLVAAAGGSGVAASQAAVVG